MRYILLTPLRNLPTAEQLLYLDDHKCIPETKSVSNITVGFTSLGYQLLNCKLFIIIAIIVNER
jgi:hypothetical protein